MRTLEDVLEEITAGPRPRLRRRHGVADAARLPGDAQAPPAADRPHPLRPADGRGGRGQRPARAARRGLPAGGGDERGRPAPSPSWPRTPAGGGTSASSGIAPTHARRKAAPIPPPVGGGDFAPGADARRIERSAQLTLASDPDDFDGIADAIFRTADRHDGFVLNSSFTQGEEDFSSGSFELRVPAEQARAGAQRPVAARDRALAQRVGHGRDRDVRLGPRPAAHRPRAAHQPAAPARAGHHRHGRARAAAAARDRRQPDHRPARRVSRHPRAHRVRDRPRRAGGQGRGRGGRARRTRRSTTRSDRSRTS